MAGVPLMGTPFGDLLPASVRSDPKVAAAAAALDAMLHFGDAEIGNVLIWARIGGLEEPALSNLAYQLHLEGYEGWHLAESLEQKRRLVKDSVKLHFYKGTRWSLERIFELLDMQGLIPEWWESDEPPADFPPYTFDLDAEVCRKIDGKFYSDLTELIFALKNVRSHLRKARIFMTVRGKTPRLAPCLIGGGAAELRPFSLESVDIVCPLPAIACACGALQTIVVYPLEDAG